MEDTIARFDFYGDGEFVKIGFSTVNINSIPIKEYFENNRVGFNNANESISSPTFNVTLIKKIYKNKKDIKENVVEYDSTEKCVNDFFIHYLVYPDMPLEFRIRVSELKSIKIHGFLEEIKFSQNIQEPFYDMSIKVLAYSDDM